MNLCSCRASLKPHPAPTFALARSISSSPYGRTHVWRRRPPVLPNPVVPLFPQRVVLADGSTYVHWTTSPRSSIKLTRDTTNNPVWNPWLAGSNPEDVEGASAGRLGRFRRKFDELGGAGIKAEWVEDTMEVKTTGKKEEPSSKQQAPPEKSSASKKI